MRRLAKDRRFEPVQAHMCELREAFRLVESLRNLLEGLSGSSVASMCHVELVPLTVDLFHVRSAEVAE